MVINRYRYYVGPLGALQALPPMVGGANAPEAPMQIPGAQHTSLSGRVTLDRTGTPKRSWAMTWENLREADRLAIDAIVHRGAGAPLRLIDPRSSNRLTADCSVCGSLTAGTAGFTAWNLITDTYTRTVSNDWSTSDSGHVWTEIPGGSGSANDFDVNGSVGTIAIQANDEAYHAILGGVTTLDSDQRISNAVSFTDVTGGQLEVCGLVARYTSVSSHYLARLEVSTAEVITLSIFRIGGVGGTAQLVASVPIGASNVSGQFVTLRFQVVGGILRAKGWLASGTQPGFWHATIYDSGISTPGNLGIRASVKSGNSNTKPIVSQYDNYQAQWSPSNVPVYSVGLIPSVFAGLVAGGLSWASPATGSRLLATAEQVPILAGSTYRFSVYASGTTNVKLAALPFDVNGVEQTLAVGSTETLTGTMQRFSWLYTPAGGVTSALFGLEAQGAGTVSTTGWQVEIDQVLSNWSFGVGCPTVTVDPQIPISYWRTKYHRIRLNLREA